MANENNVIKKGEWYEFILTNSDKYEGKCAEEPFIDKIDGFLKTRFSCRNSGKEDFSDFTIPPNEIKSIKHLLVKKIIGNNTWKIVPFGDNGRIIFGVFCYDKSDTEEMAKELISSKKRVGTFDNMKEAVDFLENQE